MARSERSRRRPWVIAAAACTVTTAVLLGLLWPDAAHHTGTAPGPGPADGPRSSGFAGARPAAFVLAPFASCDAALSDLRAHAAASVGPYGFGGVARGYASDAVSAPGLPMPAEANTVAGAASAAGASAAPASPDVSATNVQEQGVDEPDVVKADGRRLVTVTDGQLHVIDIGTRKITGTLDLTIYAGAQAAQLLVNGDHAAVILPSSAAGRYIGMPMAANGVAYSSVAPVGGGTTVLFVDLAGQPTVTGTLRLDGTYLDARMVSGVIRLVQVSAPTISFPNSHTQPDDKANTARNRTVIRSTPLSAWLPTYTVTSGATNTTRAVPCGDVSRPKNYTGASMLTVYTVDPARPTDDPQPVSVAADGDTVYATAASLYVVSNATCTWCVAQSPQPTEIHRFDITGAGKPAYLGSASVPGTLLSQYSLSDYAGHLRVAVTIAIQAKRPPVLEPQSVPPTPQPTTTNSVYVLDDDTLRITGHVDGLGNNEQIYAVRFIGAIGFVVTYRQVDPLYVLDLADPAHPRSVAAVQLSGYSDYLHDVDGGRLLGVGQSVTDEGIVSGMQVSLFDVRTPSATRLTSRLTLSNTPDESRLDPHAFLYWAPTGLVAVPIQSWQPDQSGRVLVVRVDGARLVRVGTVANPQPVTAPNDGLGIQRSLMVDGSLWTLSSAGVRVSSATSLAQQDWLPFG